MSQRTRRRWGLTWLLLGLCGLLAALVGAELHYGRQWYAQKVAALGTPAASGTAPVAAESPALGELLEPMDAYAEIVERPLFIDTRRPPEPAPEVAAAAPPPPPPRPLRATLTSIVITPERHLALVVDHASKRSVRLAEGADFAGWQVERIENEQVIFRQGEQTQVLQLRVYEPVKLPKRAKPEPAASDATADAQTTSEPEKQ